MNEKTETLHKICKALMDELDDYGKKIEKADGMSAGDLDAVDKLSHALKSIKTTIAMIEADEDGGYSGRYMPRMGMSYAENGRGGTMTGSSYARGRNARRDSMGRYSGTGYSYAAEMDGIMSDLESMMDDMPADKQRRVQQLMDELRR